MINRHFIPPQHADGILTYLQFVAVVRELWEEAHPNIPIVPTQGPQFADYPAIIYGLDIRRPHPDEPKRKMREQYHPEGVREIRTIYGQRFINIVRFTAIDPNPKKAEKIIEAFEDFMVEYTPIFKRIGASELVYERRYADNEGNQPGEDTARRAVAYRLTTEKLYETSEGIIEQIILRVRTFLENNDPEVEDESATPISTELIDQCEADPPATPLD